MLPRDVLEKLVYHRREVERIYGEFSTPKPGDAMPVSVDVYETESTLVVDAELPGVAPGDVTVSVMNDLILIEGQRARPDGVAARYHHAERAFGRFQRVVEIPCAVDTRQLRPRLERGTLRIELPKVPDRRGQWRKVEVVDGKGGV